MFNINGVFTLQKQTGVQRYAREISSRLTGNIIAPKATALIPNNIWEQLALPIISRSNLLWSPCNVGPLFKKNQIVTIHDVSVFDNPQWFSRKFGIKLRAALPILAKNCRLITTPSNFSKRRIESVLSIPSKKIQVIPCGVNEDFFSHTPDDLEVRAFTGGYKYVLTVGSIDPRKNYKRLINAWNKISHQFPEYKLIVVGSRFDCFSSIEFESKGASVIFTGHVDENTLRSLYKSASLFVYPSLYEGFGIPPLEAMAAGTPVITSEISAIGEVVADGAFKVDPTNENILADAIDYLLRDEAARNELIEKGKHIARKFCWTKSAELMQITVNSML